MDLPNISQELMREASEALDKVIKSGGTPQEARAAFEAVIKGGEPADVQTVTLGGDVHPLEPEPTKPARKPRADKGKPRKQPPPRPEDLSIAQGLELVKQSEEDAKKAAKQRAEIGAMVIDLFAALKGAMK